MYTYAFGKRLTLPQLTISPIRTGVRDFKITIIVVVLRCAGWPVGEYEIDVIIDVQYGHIRFLRLTTRVVGACVTTGEPLVLVFTLIKPII
jgi:hypothetical protein